VDVSSCSYLLGYYILLLGNNHQIKDHAQSIVEVIASGHLARGGSQQRNAGVTHPGGEGI
jgi:hypothetical protein